jgi:cytochrome c553
MRPAKVATLLAAGLGLTALAAACNTDPVHSDAVNALGPEVSGIPQGQYHRAGQPCVTCHGDEGPASTQFTMAGTVFYGPANTANPIGVGNVMVTLEDDTQSVYTAVTNCVGNFWVTSDQWPGHPQFPVLVTIAGTVGTYSAPSMQSHIGRTGSCADCHQYPTTNNFYQTPGLVHLFTQDSATYTGDGTCPVSPVPPGFGGGP